jgi:hypothetical protein
MDAGLVPGLAPPIATSEHFIDNLYHVFLDRAPGQREVDNWATALHAGLTPDQAGRQFLASPEYQTNLIWDGYLQLLGREPENGVTDRWRGAIQHGLTDEQFTRVQLTILRAFS